MRSWNETYQHEAEAIAASVVGESGFEWKAAQIERGKFSRGQEVTIAMRALMVARGELELPETSYSVTRDIRAMNEKLREERSSRE
jgi:cell division protein FtsL